MTRMLTAWAVLFIFSWASAADLFQQNKKPISDKDLQKILDDFDYQSEVTVTKLHTDDSSWDDCWTYEMKYTTNQITATGQMIPLNVDAKFYVRNPGELKPGQQLPLVVQLPPMGGVNVLDRWMGSALCDQDIASVIITNNFTNFDGKTAPPVEDHDDAFRRTIAAVKGAIQFGHEHDLVDASRAGIFGVSLGGILGSFTMGVINDLQVGYFLVSGGDVPYILAHSDQGEVSKLRQRRFQEHGFQNNEEYEAWLRTKVFYDPLDTVKRIPTDSLSLLISENDKNVPSVKQMELFEAMGQPEAEYKSSGHVMTIIGHLLWASNREKIAKYYEAQFKKENNRRMGEDFLGELVASF